MKLFKIIASRGGRVLFDDRLEAFTPREARNQMRSLLGLHSLTGIVYSITEIPVDLIGEIAEARVSQALLRYGEGNPPPSVEEIIRAAAAEEVRRQLAELRAELLAASSSSVAADPSDAPPARFDPFQQTAPEESSDPPAEEAPTPIPSPEIVEQVQARVEERRRRQPRGRPAVTTDGRKIDWRAVKRLYLQNRSLKQTAAAFDLSPNTVKARARKEGWAQ